VTLKDVFREINNAILDLQGADYNTYERPLKRLAKALKSEDLDGLNRALKANVNFDAFLASSNQGGSFMGSASLTWPDEQEKEFGLILVLIERAAADPNWLQEFVIHWYYTGDDYIDCIRKFTSAVVIPFGRDYKAYVEATLNGGPSVVATQSGLNKIFIVHGHDDLARETVARFVATIGLEPIILHEQADRGMTITEKLIAYSNVGFAIVLLTPDDIGRSLKEPIDQPRARQNVLLELGYFVGKLGRERVCALKKGVLEIPSDYLNVAYTPLDESGGWQLKLIRELKASGYDIDMNKIA
jgi:predicted nucleotide-binding protein